MDQLPRLGKRELICLLLFTCNYVVSVWRGFLFLWVLGMGYVILLWHSLSLPYNYFEHVLETIIITSADVLRKKTECIESLVRLFADATAVYLTGTSLEDANTLQTDLDTLQEWERTRDMEFNPGKCQVLHVSRSKQPLQSKYTSMVRSWNQ